MTEKKERKSGMVRVRGGFSDIQGISRCNTVLQIDEFDDNTRTLLVNEINYLLELLFDKKYEFLGEKNKYDTNIGIDLYRDLNNDVFCKKINVPMSFSYDLNRDYKEIDDVIEQAVFNEVLDIIQYICQWIEKRIIFHKGEFFSHFNILFEKEFIGYRFVDGKIIQITDKQEINAIERACDNPYDGCRRQIQNAVAFLSDRKTKDYKNCIKESICAVESICAIIVGDNKATLSDSLKKLEKSGIYIHPALNTAFQKLYAYTSDQGGIRHAEGLFESDVTFEDAKFMLVICSAFINYLIAEKGRGDN